MQDNHTAEIGEGADMDFVQTHYSPTGVLLLYFRGDASAEVDKHFNRTFSELCCLPGSSASDNGMESSHWEVRIDVTNWERHFAFVARKLLHLTTRLQFI